MKSVWFSTGSLFINGIRRSRMQGCPSRGPRGCTASAMAQAQNATFSDGLGSAAMTPQTRVLSVTLSLLTLFVITGCGVGSHSGMSAVPSNNASAAPMSTAVQITLLIPSASNARSSIARRVQYVSVSTTSLTVSDVADSGGTQASTTVNVSSCPTVTGGAACQITVPAIIGGNTIGVSAYDGVNGGGNLLSTASTHTTVLAGTANALQLTLGGVVRSLSLAVDQPAPFAGTPSTITLYPTAKDADGNTITGPFSQVVTLTDSDVTGATTLTQKALTASDASIAISYTGAAASATISATISGTQSYQVVPAVITPRASAQYLYVALTSWASAIATNAPIGGTVAQFSLDANGNVAPVAALTDPIGTVLPQAIAGDSSHRLYVFNNAYASNALNSQGMDIAVYGPGAAGSYVHPIAALNNADFTVPVGFAADNNGGVYVVNGGTLAGGPAGNYTYFASSKFSAPSNVVTVAPSSTSPANVQCSGGELGPLALDLLGRIVAVSAGGYTTSPAIATGMAGAPIASFCTYDTTFQGVQYGTTRNAVATDANNNVVMAAYVANTGGTAFQAQCILTFPPLAQYPGSLPINEIGGSNTRLAEGGITGLASSRDGRIYVLLALTNAMATYYPYEILVFPAGASGNTAPSQVISGSNTLFNGMNVVRAIAVF